MDPVIPQSPLPINQAPVPTPIVPQQQPMIVPEQTPQPVVPKQKGPFSILLTVIILGVIIVGGYFIFQKYIGNNNRLSTPQITATSTPTPSPDSISNWKSYVNDKYGFEVKYYPEYIPTEDIKDKEDPGQFTYLLFVKFGTVPVKDVYGYELRVNEKRPLSSYRLELIGHITDKIDSEEEFKINNHTWTKINYKIFLTTDYVPVTIAITNSDKYTFAITSSSSDIDKILSTLAFTDDIKETAGWKEYQVKKAGLMFKAPTDYNVEISDTSKFGSTDTDKAYSFEIQNYPFNAPPPDNPFKLEANYYFGDYSSNLNESKKGLTSLTETLVAGLAAIQGNGYDIAGGSTKKQYFYTYFVKDGGMFVSQTSDISTINKEITNKILSTLKYQ